MECAQCYYSRDDLKPKMWAFFLSNFGPLPGVSCFVYIHEKERRLKYLGNSNLRRCQVFLSKTNNLQTIV